MQKRAEAERQAWELEDDLHRRLTIERAVTPQLVPSRGLELKGKQGNRRTSEGYAIAARVESLIDVGDEKGNKYKPEDFLPGGLLQKQILELTGNRLARTATMKIVRDVAGRKAAELYPAKLAKRRFASDN
jgi:hypothetical protein